MHQRLHFFIKRLLENIFVQIANQMDQAFLLCATDRIIRRVEIGDQYTVETTQELLSNIPFAGRRPKVDHFLHAREYPHVTAATFSAQVSFISMYELSMQQLVLDLFIGVLIKLRSPPLQAIDCWLTDLITKERAHTS